MVTLQMVDFRKPERPSKESPPIGLIPEDPKQRLESKPKTLVGVVQHCCNGMRTRVKALNEVVICTKRGNVLS